MSYSDDVKLLNKIQSRKYRNNLIKARQSAKGRDLIKNTKNLVKSATPWGAASLVKYLFLTHPFCYLSALLAALLKDLLDFGIIGSLPVIGTVLTLCASIFIFFMLLLAGSSGKMKIVNSIVRRYLILTVGTLIEFFFGINFLPILTLTVLVIWFMAAAEKKQADEVEKKEAKLQEEYA